jgi:hypothetical protein
MLFFLDEKVLLLPVVYEKYNYLLLSMNFNGEFYKFYFTEFGERPYAESFYREACHVAYSQTKRH